MRDDEHLEGGSATVEMIGWLPIMALLTLVAFQALLVMGTPVLVEGAARTGSHAAALGLDPVSSARDALPGFLRDRASVARSGDSVIVSVRVPGPLPDRFASLRDVRREAAFPDLDPS